MPNRIIRQDILTSEPVNMLDPPAEVFYRRLLSVVDDHGLFDARPSILRSALYPLRLDRVREADCTRWMAECQKAGLIVLYHHDGKPYGQALKTKWVARSEPRYPLPTTANNCAQLQTIAPVVVDVVVTVDGVDGASPSAPPAAKSGAGQRLPVDWTLPDDWKTWALAERPGFDVATEAAKFADYWHAVAGAKGRKADWPATWRNWVRNARGTGAFVAPPPATNPGGISPRLDPAEEKRREADALAAMKRQMEDLAR